MVNTRSWTNNGGTYPNHPTDARLITGHSKPNKWGLLAIDGGDGTEIPLGYIGDNTEYKKYGAGIKMIGGCRMGESPYLGFLMSMTRLPGTPWSVKSPNYEAEVRFVCGHFTLHHRILTPEEKAAVQQAKPSQTKCDKEMMVIRIAMIKGCPTYSFGIVWPGEVSGKHSELLWRHLPAIANSKHFTFYVEKGINWDNHLKNMGRTFAEVGDPKYQLQHLTRNGRPK